MGKDSTKGNDNAYFRARKEAAIYNEKLFSREGAAELLGISVSTLADYELGNTKVVPVDKVVLMADLYNCPELKYKYCKCECPIGRQMPLATEAKGIEGIALRMIQQFDSKELGEMKDSLVDIAADGIISDDEKPKVESILRKLNDMAVVINEMKLVGEKALRG